MVFCNLPVCMVDGKLWESVGIGVVGCYKFTLLSLNELTITDTELKLIATAANIGDNNKPNAGYKTPAAIGTPAEL